MLKVFEVAVYSEKADKAKRTVKKWKMEVTNRQEHETDPLNGKRPEPERQQHP